VIQPLANSEANAAREDMARKMDALLNSDSEQSEPAQNDGTAQ
jgi:hypothetical protein